MRELKTAAIAVVTFTVVLGLAYPLFMTGVGQVVFPGSADGSMVERDGKVVGSALIGQDFAEAPGVLPEPPVGHGLLAVGDLLQQPGPEPAGPGRPAQGLRQDATCGASGPYTPGLTAARIPSDAVTTSASGVDPDISEANALIQANRVAQERGLPLARVRALVEDNASRPLFGLAGDKSINVLELNLALDREASR